MIDKVERIFREAVKSLNAINENHIRLLSEISKECCKVISADRKIILFGNGGSASDSQHIACEFVGKFYKSRRPYKAIALTTNTSNLTAIANDFDFRDIFARQVEALGEKGDIAWGFSTSGNSENVIRGIDTANKKGLKTIIFTGKNGGKLKRIGDYCFLVPSSKTPRIQELHILGAHIICELAEEKLASV